MQIIPPPKDVALCIDFKSVPWKVKENISEEQKKKAEEWIKGLKKKQDKMYGTK